MDPQKEKFLQISSSPLILWFILGLVLLFFAIFSVILVYHWRRYGFESEKVAFTEKIYFPVSIILIGAAILSIIIYSTI